MGGIFGGGSTEINIPQQTLDPAIAEQLQIQTDILRALQPTEEQLALQQQTTTRLSEFLGQFEPFPTAEEVAEREEKVKASLMEELGQTFGDRSASIIEQANRFGFNPAQSIGRLEQGRLLAEKQIFAGDALQRAQALSGFQQQTTTDFLRNIGLTQQLISAPFARASAPAQAAGQTVAGFQSEQSRQAANLAMAQAQLSQGGQQGLMGSLGGIGSLLGGIGGFASSPAGPGLMALLGGI